ncbi:MAG: hypothetical protein JKX85_06725 [Phycisphaeraceae bacterium]|nr:hypothetical protein [Phycisphaeraceae bacterium]
MFITKSLSATIVAVEFVAYRDTTPSISNDRIIPSIRTRCNPNVTLLHH